MNRAYKEWTRAACTWRQQEIDAEKRALQVRIDRLEGEAEAHGGQSIEARSEYLRIMNSVSALVRQQTALIREFQDINLELYIRSDPSLVAQYGPGAD